MATRGGRKLLQFLVLWLALTALILPPGFAWLLSGQLAKPPMPVRRTPEQGLGKGAFTDPLVDFGLPFEEVEFATVGDATLRGWYVPGVAQGRSAIVAAHGAGSDRRGFLPILPELHAAGYGVLFFDFRGHGISDGTAPGARGGLGLHEDVIAAVRFVREERAASRVAAMGASLGATSVIMAAARSNDIDAVISQGSATNVYELLRAQDTLRWLPDWMIRLTVWMVRLRTESPNEWGAEAPPGALGAIGAIAPRPLFLIHGSDDESIPVDQAERLYTAAGEPKSLWIVEGGHHADLRKRSRDEYAARVAGFLERHLPLESETGAPAAE